jgi:hypothetical protein
MNRAPDLTDKLCRLLQRAGADFNSPNNGQQSAVADQRSSRCATDNALA